MLDSDESVVFSCRLSVKERNAWKAHCAKLHGDLSPSKVSLLLMRNEMGYALDGSGLLKQPRSAGFNAVQSIPSGFTERFYAYFTVSESSAIRLLAKESGLSISKWIARTARAGIRIEAEPPPKELNNLIDSTRNLKIIGNNLNQIARRLNKDPNDKKSGIDRLDIKQLIKTINAHSKVANRYIKSCRNRWDLV